MLPSLKPLGRSVGRTGAGGCSKNVWGRCLVSKNVWRTCAAHVQPMSTCAVLMHAVISLGYICRYVSRESSSGIRFLWGSCSALHGSHPSQAVGWCRQPWAACLQAHHAPRAAQGVVCVPPILQAPIDHQQVARTHWGSQKEEEEEIGAGEGWGEHQGVICKALGWGSAWDEPSCPCAQLLPWGLCPEWSFLGREEFVLVWLKSCLLTTFFVVAVVHLA